MAQPSSSIPRASVPGAGNFNVSSPAVPPRCSNVAHKISLQDLQNTPLPPLDHAFYELPSKSIQERRQSVAGQGRIVWPEHEADVRMVGGFLFDGVLTSRPMDLDTLAIFLLTNKLFNALAWLVVQSRSYELNLKGCELGSGRAGMVAEWAQDLSFEVRINLAKTGIDAQGAVLLAEALESNTISHLDLDGNPLGGDGVQALCEGLLRNSSLRSLSLAGVKAGNLGLQAIAGVLDTHPSLSSLNLDGNSFDDQAAARFAATLGHNKRLTSLFMEYIQASDASLCIVAGALGTNTKLERFSFSTKDADELSVALADAVAGALVVNRTLTCLSMITANISTAAGNRLLAAIEINTTLRCFSGRFNPFTESVGVRRQIEGTLEAHKLIEAAGNALSDLSQRPEWAVPIPPEVGQSIAALVAQVATEQGKLTAMRSIVQAGPLGLQIPFV